MGDFLCQQLQIQASDQGKPEKKTNARVVVTVRRDSSTPRIDGSFDRTIDVNTKPGSDTPVTTIRASDPDKVVSDLYFCLFLWFFVKYKR